MKTPPQDESPALRRQLDESRERYKALLASALDCIVTMDAAGRIVDFNPAAERTFGYSSEQAVGRTVEELLVPPQHRDAHRRGLSEYHRSGTGPVLGRRIEIEALRADGTQFPVELAIVPTSVAGQVFFTAYIRDLSERNAAEKALRTHEEQLRLLIDALPAFIAYVDRDQRYRFNNRRYEEWFGLSSQSIYGRHMREILGEAYTALQGHVEKALAGEAHHFQEWVTYEGTRRRCIEGSYLPDRDSEGQVRGVFVVAADITERKQAEEARESLVQRLMAVQTELQEKISDLEAFHDVVVDRELKMIELKKELDELRGRRQGVTGEGSG